MIRAGYHEGFLLIASTDCSTDTLKSSGTVIELCLQLKLGSIAFPTRSRARVALPFPVPTRLHLARFPTPLHFSVPLPRSPHLHSFPSLRSLVRSTLGDGVISPGPNYAQKTGKLDHPSQSETPNYTPVPFAARPCVPGTVTPFVSKCRNRAIPWLMANRRYISRA